MCLGLKGEVSSNVKVAAVWGADSDMHQECVVWEAECNLGREGNLLDNSPLSELGSCYNQLGSAWRKGLISEAIPQVVYKQFTCMEKKRDLSFFLYTATILKQREMKESWQSRHYNING